MSDVIEYTPRTYPPMTVNPGGNDRCSRCSESITDSEIRDLLPEVYSVSVWVCPNCLQINVKDECMTCSSPRPASKSVIKDKSVELLREVLTALIHAVTGDDEDDEIVRVHHIRQVLSLLKGLE